MQLPLSKSTTYTTCIHFNIHFTSLCCQASGGNRDTSHTTCKSLKSDPPLVSPGNQRNQDEDGFLRICKPGQDHSNIRNVFTSFFDTLRTGRFGDECPSFDFSKDENRGVYYRDCNHIIRHPKALGESTEANKTPTLRDIRTPLQVTGRNMINGN